jgi:hypothetical protein
MKSRRIRLLIITLSAFCANNCQKKNSNFTNGNPEGKQSLLSAAPSSVATINTYMDAEKQYQRLAIGMAVITNRSQTVDRNAFFKVLKDKIRNKQPEDITLYEFNEELKNAQINFMEPSATSDFYDAIASKINSYNPSLSLPTWLTDFFFGWQYSSSGALGSDFFRITIDIPELDYQLQNNHDKMNTLVVPDLGFYPTVGYSFDNSLNKLMEVSIPNEDAYEDLMDLHTYYIVSLGTEYVDGGLKITNNCDNLEGKNVAWEPLDFFCNEKCGENEANSPFDCSIANSKTVYLRKVGFTNDHKEKSSSCKDQQLHYKSALGKYKVGFSATILHANKKVETREDVMLKPILLEKVLRKRTRKNGTVQQRGVSEFMLAENKKDNCEPIVAENYCPVRSIIYLGFFEKNGLIKPGIVEVEQGADLLATWSIGGISISSIKGRGSNCKFDDDVYYKIIPFNDPNWAPGLKGSDKIMIYNSNKTGDDEFNFELYYFVDKKHK